MSRWLWSWSSHIILKVHFHLVEIKKYKKWWNPISPYGGFPIEIAILLDKHSPEFILFKGVVLSLQTTNSFYKRGHSNDLDLIISENDISKVVKVLGNWRQLPEGSNSSFIK